MIDEKDKLPLALCMRDDGHVDELALAAVADGQDAILPPEPLLHLDTCDLCTRRLGESALLSSRVDAVMTALAPAAAPLSQPARFPVPVRMIVGALALAILGLAPAVLAAPVRLASVANWFTRSMPLFLRTFAQLFRGAEGGLGVLGIAVSVASALVLISLGLAVARAMPRHTFVQGVTS